MDIDFDQSATLNGMLPSSSVMRGPTLATGTVAKMVKLGLEHIEAGYVGVMVLCDDGKTLDSTAIRELAARPDFPRGV